MLPPELTFEFTEDGPTREDVVQAYIDGGATPEEAKAAADELFDPPEDPEDFYLRLPPKA